MSEILRQVGWTEGFNIPALNDENRILESEVREFILICAIQVANF